MPLIWSGCLEFDPLVGQILDTPPNNGISTSINAKLCMAKRLETIKMIFMLSGSPSYTLKH